MTAATYTTVALVMRYFFTASILLILFMLIWQSVNEFKEVQRMKSQVAGTYSRYIVFTAPEELRGVKYALERETTLGRAAKCKICLAFPGIKRRHANIHLHGNATWLTVGKRRGALLNAEPFKKRSVELTSGDKIELCGVSFTYMQRTSADKKESCK